MQTDFEKAEEEGLTKLVYIPLHNQEGQLGKLIKKFPEEFIAILNDYISRLKTKIGFLDEDFHNLKLLSGTPDLNSTWEEFEELVQTRAQQLNHNRLVHLTPKEIIINANEEILLCCEYDSRNLDKYIPPHLQVVFTQNSTLTQQILEDKVPVGALYNFAPVYFAVPCFGRYVDE